IVFDDAWQKVWSLEHDHAGSVQGSAFSPDGEYAFWGGSGAYIWACRIIQKDGGCQRASKVDDWVYAIDVSLDGRFVAYASGGKIQFFDQALQQQSSLGDEAAHVFALRFDRTSQYLVAAGSDGAVSFYDTRSQKLIERDRTHSRDTYSIALSSSGARI